MLKSLEKSFVYSTIKKRFVSVSGFSDPKREMKFRPLYFDMQYMLTKRPSNLNTYSFYRLISLLEKFLFKRKKKLNEASEQVS